MPLFEQSRTCADCGYLESRHLPAELAAFEERRRWSTCGQCGSENFSSLSHPIPPLDHKLLEEWISNPNLSFSQQDEDIVLATPESLPLLQELVQKRGVPKLKRSTLLSALCVIIYENTFDPDFPDSTIDTNLGNDVVRFLNEHLWLFDEIEDGYFHSYITDIVYPQIGLIRKSEW